MQQFALATVRPRSIAWLIRLDEWERLEVIIKYNSAMLGGYYNVLIPLTERDALTEEYQRFLLDYDPDFIVLAPDMATSQIDLLSQISHSFCLIHWNEVEKVAFIDPLSGTPNINATMSSFGQKILSRTITFPNALIAVGDYIKPDESNLALIACGDVHPREPMLHVFDGKTELDSEGYREEFLHSFLKPECEPINIMAHLEGREGDYCFVPAPNRYELQRFIVDNRCFPLSGIYETLSSCYRLQHSPLIYASFIGLTAHYKNSNGASRHTKDSPHPSMVVLISEHFGVEEAILFWNLRAMEIYVAWLSLTNVENHAEELDRWLNADGGGGFYTMMSKFQITFSTHRKDINRLNEIISDLKRRRNKTFLSDILIINIIEYDKLIFYDYIPRAIKQEHISVMRNRGQIVFLPKLPSKENLGSYSIDLEYSELMTPRGMNFTGVWRNLYEREYHWFKPYEPIKTTTTGSWKMPYCRVNRTRYLRFQLHTEDPIKINLLSLQSTVTSIFQNAGFSRLDLSSTARYHTIFVDRAGGLEHAIYYLANKLYRSFLEVLMDNSSKNKTGWILEHPSKRRVFNHFHLWRMVNRPTPSTTEEYYQISDRLPEEVIPLLEKQILERGFFIACNTCSFRSWYPAELIGQDFTCARCFQKQVYQSNPLWLYKLPEVVFQGFNNDMQVPLLALSYMKRKSMFYFDWLPDSNVFWIEEQKEVSRNIDIICVCDGKLYIGEAKSAGSIEKDQFSFYQQVCQKVAIDGIIFATSQKYWDRKTLAYIETLKQSFLGDVVILTEEDLYPAK